MCNFSKKGGTREWCLVKPTLASPIFFLRWVNTDEHEFYSEHFSQEFPYLSTIRGTRPPSPREVNSRGSSPAVGCFAPSGALSCLPRIIEMIQICVHLRPKILSNLVIFLFLSIISVPQNLIELEKYSIFFQNFQNFQMGKLLPKIGIIFLLPRSLRLSCKL